MSNIGKKPITIKDGVSIETLNGRVRVTATKGTLETVIPNGVNVVVEDGKIIVKKSVNTKDVEKFYGLTRALIANMVQGVTLGFEKKLELVGVGYRAKVEGNELVLNVGFAVPVRLKAPTGIVFRVDENVITVTGIDKELIGDVATKIRAVRIPDPYKGKGIRYQNEYIRRKVGKAATKAAGGK